METILYETRAQYRALKRGDLLVRAGEIASAWEVKAGALVLQGGTVEGYGPVQVVLPGDIVGAESLFGDCHTFTSMAVMATQLERVQIFDGVSAELTVQQAFRQQQRRQVEMAFLRSGAVRLRLTYLLQLLAQSNGLPDGLLRRELPALRVMASIIGAAPETVCRELNALMPLTSTEASSCVVPLRQYPLSQTMRIAA